MMRRWILMIVTIGLIGLAAVITQRRNAVGAGGGLAEARGDELLALSKAKLYERAQHNAIVGRSRMNKAELVEALLPIPGR